MSSSVIVSRAGIAFRVRFVSTGTEYSLFLRSVFAGFDYNTPIEETMRALHDVVQMGWVRYVGMSSCYAWQFWRMQSEL